MSHKIYHQNDSAVLKNYDVLKAELSELSVSRDANKAKAEGLLENLTSFKMYFGLRLSSLIYSAGEQVSKNLQRHDIDAQSATSAIKVFKAYLSKMCCVSSYDEFYKSCVADGVERHGCDPPEASVPRSRKAPSRFDENCDTGHVWDSSQYFRSQYYEVIDVVISELDMRFDERSLHSLIASE